MDTQASMAGKLTWKGEQGEEKDEESEQLHSRGRRGLQNKTGQERMGRTLVLVQLIDRLQAKNTPYTLYFDVVKLTMNL